MSMPLIFRPPASAPPTWGSTRQPACLQPRRARRQPPRAAQGIPREGGAGVRPRKNFYRRESRITKRFGGGSGSAEQHDRAYRPMPRVSSFDDV